MPSLFDPLQLGDLLLPNRIIMSPLTRSRAGATRVPNALMAEYYAQRASAGLIITEATSVAPMGVGYAATPALWSQEHVAGWKLVTKAVHDAGGRIFSQLWHVGRVSDPMFLDGALPIAPSAIAPKGHVNLVRPKKEFVLPRAVDRSEIPGIVEGWRKAAMNASMAGFDGVEMHGANGYLLDQFLQDGSNHRTDDYGGSIENRARLMLEVTDAVLSVWEPGQVGMHLAPRMDLNSMGDSDQLGTFTYVARELGERGLGFLLVREQKTENWIGPHLKKAFGGTYIVNEKFTFELGQEVLAAGEADAVAFGKDFIANPDLVARFRTGAALNAQDPTTFYEGGAQGYIDYPVMESASA